MTNKKYALTEGNVLYALGILMVYHESSHFGRRLWQEVETAYGPEAKANDRSAQRSNYRVADKMAQEIWHYRICRVRRLHEGADNRPHRQREQARRQGWIRG